MLFCLWEDVIVIDVGSIKGMIMNEVEILFLKEVFFIGGYLMVGFYKMGVESVKVYLFENVFYILILMYYVLNEYVEELKDWLKGMGLYFFVLNIEEYDYVIGIVSYFLYFIVVGLVK